jgi:hypothetical protein
LSKYFGFSNNVGMSDLTLAAFLPLLWASLPAPLGDSSTAGRPRAMQPEAKVAKLRRYRNHLG